MLLRTLILVVFVAGLFAPLVGCDDSPPPPNPFDPPPDAPKPAPKVTEAPKLEGPPRLQITAEGPKVGWTNVLIEKKDGRERLRKELEANKQHFTNQDVTVDVDRKAKLNWTVTMVQELDQVGVLGITIRTETRKEFSPTLKFVPQRRVKRVEPCSLVMMVLKDRATAVWKISGGTASRRSRGFAGPDLSTTAETIERYIKKCESSTTMFVSADESIEWGLTYDLAASAQKVKGANFKRVVLLDKTPTAGRRVEL